MPQLQRLNLVYCSQLSGRKSHRLATAKQRAAVIPRDWVCSCPGRKGYGPATKEHIAQLLAVIHPSGVESALSQRTLR
jgi:hypothetical protein